MTEDFAVGSKDDHLGHKAEDSIEGESITLSLEAVQ